MPAWKRWQDWLVVVLGVLLFITPLLSPLVFGGPVTATAAYTAYVMGVLLIAFGLYTLARPGMPTVEWIQVALGLLLIASPFALGFMGVVGIAYSAWTIGVLVVLLAGSVLLMQRRHPAMAAH